MDNSITRPWSDLPADLISTIANYVTRNDNYLDIRSFRSVCQSWRTSCPPLSRLSILSPILPLSVDHPCPPLLTSPRRDSVGSVLSVTVIYVLTQTGLSKFLPSSWIVFVDEFETGKLKIRVPFSNESLLWPVFSPRSVNLFDFHVHELGRFYNLSFPYMYDDGITVRLAKPNFRSYDVDKVVLCADGSAAVVLFEWGKLGLIKLKFGNFDDDWEAWEVMHNGKGFRFDDIVGHQGRVLGVDRRGRLYLIPHSPSKIYPITRSIADRDERRNRLVTSQRWLYLVVRCDVSAIFKVYRLNGKRRKWVKINSIGARVFFFGRDFSFSIPAQILSLNYGNSIMFKQHSFGFYKGDVDDKDVFCNSKRHGLYIGICNLKEATLVGAVENELGSSHLFWPPPAWFWPTSRLERIMKVEATLDELLVRSSMSLETNFQDPTVEQIDMSSADSRRQACLWMQNLIHHFKARRVLDRVKENEHELEASSTDCLNRMERRRVHTETCSVKTEESQHASEDNLCWSLLEWVWFTINRQDAITLEAESFISDMVRYYDLLRRTDTPLQLIEMGEIVARMDMCTLYL